MEPFITRVRTNLIGALQSNQRIEGIMMTGDKDANQIIVEVYKGNDRVIIPNDEDTKIVGYFVRSDGATLETDGEVTAEGYAKVVIPAVAYEISGLLNIAIRILEGEETIIDDHGVEQKTWRSKIVIAALSCYVQVTETGTIIDIHHVIPDVQQLLHYIDLVNEERILIAQEEAVRVQNEQGRETAEAAREAAEATRQSTFETNEAARQADYQQHETQRATNEGFRNAAEQQRVANETARQLNETTRQENETTRIGAEQQRQQNTTAAIAKINGMTVDAHRLDPYSTPEVTITEVDGHKHISFGLVSGDPFVIRKTYASIAEMEADFSGTDVKTGEFVVITSTVEDPDNAKMFVKAATQWTFITDLSGAQGIVGPTGPIGPTGTSITATYFDPDAYTLTLYFSDGTQYTTGSIRGAVGPKGTSISSSTYDPTNHTITIYYEDGTHITTGDLKGEQGTPGAPGINSAQFEYDSENSHLHITYNYQ